METLRYDGSTVRHIIVDIQQSSKSNAYVKRVAYMFMHIILVCSGLWLITTRIEYNIFGELNFFFFFVDSNPHDINSVIIKRKKRMVDNSSKCDDDNDDDDIIYSTSTNYISFQKTNNVENEWFSNLQIFSFALHLHWTHACTHIKPFVERAYKCVYVCVCAFKYGFSSQSMYSKPFPATIVGPPSRSLASAEQQTGALLMNKNRTQYLLKWQTLPPLFRTHLPLSPSI